MKKILFIGVFGISLLSARDFTDNITKRQAYCFDTLFYSLGEKGLPGLIWNQGKLTALGEEVKPVPPLESLCYIMKHPRLLQCMRKAQKRTITVWPRFIGDFSKKCNQKDVYEGIQNDLALFAEDVGVNVADLQEFVDEKNWDGFVKHLLNKERT